MTGWIEDDVLRFEGLDDADIALLNKELPDLDNLINVVKSHQAQFDRVLALLTVLQKIVDKQQQLGK